MLPALPVAVGVSHSNWLNVKLLCARSFQLFLIVPLLFYLSRHSTPLYYISLFSLPKGHFHKRQFLASPHYTVAQLGAAIYEPFTNDHCWIEPQWSVVRACAWRISNCRDWIDSFRDSFDKVASRAANGNLSLSSTMTPLSYRYCSSRNGKRHCHQLGSNGKVPLKGQDHFFLMKR